MLLRNSAVTTKTLGAFFEAREEYKSDNLGDYHPEQIAPEYLVAFNFLPVECSAYERPPPYKEGYMALPNPLAAGLYLIAVFYQAQNRTLPKAGI